MAAKKKPKPTAELFKDMSMEDYHNQTDVISKSLLQKFSDCPARFKHLYIDGGVEPATKSLRLGSLVHTLCLEPELYKKSYYVLPVSYKDDKGKKKKMQARSNMKVYQEHMIKAGWKMVTDEYESISFEATKKAKIVITQEVKDQAEGMAKAIANYPEAVALMEGPGYVEASIFFEYEGIKFRCRPDDMKNNGVINDPKITKSNKPALFRTDAWNYGYHLSAALTSIGYEALYGKKPDNYTLICVEQVEPYIVQCYDTYRPFDPITGLSLYDMGMYELDKLVARYKECKESDHWPAYFEGIEPLGAPAWAVKQMVEGK